MKRLVCAILSLLLGCVPALAKHCGLVVDGHLIITTKPVSLLRIDFATK